MGDALQAFVCPELLLPLEPLSGKLLAELPSPAVWPWVRAGALWHCGVLCAGAVCRAREPLEAGLAALAFPFPPAAGRRCHSGLSLNCLGGRTRVARE